MKLKLESDFNENWDSAFDTEGLIHRRFTTDGSNRLQMFNLFRELQLKFPLYGTFTKFIELGYPLDGDVIVYTDQKSHCGEGKFKKQLGELSEFEKTCLIAEFINRPETPFTNRIKSESIRQLFIGERCFQMRYVSYEDWRSNCGDGDITNLTELLPCPKVRYKIHYPMFAIDFVNKGIDKIAVDFNVAPGTIGIGLNKFIYSSQMVLTLKKWYQDYFNGKFDG